MGSNSTRYLSRHWLLLHGLWIDSARWLPASGLRRYLSFSIRIDPPVNILLLLVDATVDTALSVDSSTRSMPRCQSILHLIRQLVLILLMMRLRDDALLHRQYTTSFSFSNQYNLLLCRRLVLDIVLAPILIACLACSCRSWYRYTLVLLWECSCRHSRGFSFRVGCGTNCTQYLFRDHFFCENTAASPLL